MDLHTLTAEFAKADRERSGKGKHEAIRIYYRDRAVGRGRRTMPHDDSTVTVGRRVLRAMCICLLSLLCLYFLMALPLAWYQVKLIYWNGTHTMQADMPDGWKIREYVSQNEDYQFAAYVHEGGNDRPTVVYLHGRGEDFGTISYITDTYVKKGWTVVAPEYAGFAGLKGRPNERIIKAEMGKVYDDLIEHGLRPGMLMIHGNSLGAGPALQLAQFPHAFLFLSAPVGNMSSLIGHYVPYYPTILLEDKWDNWKQATTRYRADAQIIHAADDSIVPVEQGRRLAKEGHMAYREYPDGGHMIARNASRIQFENNRFSYVE